MSSDEEAKAYVATLAKHAIQVEEGLIPKDSPPMFVRPEGIDAMVDGLPSWFGGKANYKPTPEALAEFSKRVPRDGR